MSESKDSPISKIFIQVAGAVLTAATLYFIGINTNGERAKAPENEMGKTSTVANDAKSTHQITENKKEQFSIVGAWSGVIEGDRIVWNVYGNGTEEFTWYHTTNTQYNKGLWRLEDDILYEDWENGNSDVCQIEFISQGHLVLTVLENGNRNNRKQQRHYYLLNTVQQ